MDRIKKYIARGREIEASGAEGWESGDYFKTCFASDHAVRHHARLLAALEVASGRIRGLAESSPYDGEAKWAEGVLGEIAAILEGK